MISLFERVLRELQLSDDMMTELADKYRKMGLYCNLANEDDEPFIDVADNPEFDYYWNDPTHTGMFARFRHEDGKLIAHINSIVVSKNDRGGGIAGKLLDTMIDVVSPDVIEVGDMSEGFWKHFETKHPEIKFWYED